MTEAAVKPKPEPEVEQRRKYPKPGGAEWAERYAQTMVVFRTLMDVCPSSEPAVAQAMSELAFAFGEDLKRNGS